MVESHDSPHFPNWQNLWHLMKASSHNIFWHLMLLRRSLGDWTWLQSRKSGSFTSKHWKKNKALLHQLSCQKQQFTALDSKTALLWRAKILHHPEERHRPTRAGTSPQNRNAKFLFENLNVQEALPQRPPKPRREKCPQFLFGHLLHS